MVPDPRRRPLRRADSTAKTRCQTSATTPRSGAIRVPAVTPDASRVTLDLAAIRAAARGTLGHRKLLPGQADAIRQITSGRDTLAILPTGGGKTAIYQLAGLAIDGPTVVISPLIALQRDQLDGLRELGLPAGAVNSTVAGSDRESTIAAFERGELEFLLLAPEQLSDRDTLGRIRAGRPSLLV